MLQYDLAIGHPVPAHVICHVISGARQPIEVLSLSHVTHMALLVLTSGQPFTALEETESDVIYEVGVGDGSVSPDYWVVYHLRYINHCFRCQQITA